MKGIHKMETRVEVSSKDPQMDPAATFLLIEARETRKRSAAVLSESIPVSKKCC